MTKEEVLQKVQELIDAPSCYSGLKDIATAYLAAVGQAGEKDAAEKLLAELEADVNSIDDVIPFFASNEAKKIFGEQQATALLAQAHEVKASGGDTCFCPACTAGKAILDNRSALLG
ncbi:heat-shock protein Hsp90 [Selenomonas sp. GACV-9]|uniref:heat-shock protein Hsp90 n=1 Tax=Selenomonas sp. GACV-9 TaxID=3158782 RepID=UPI00094D4811